MNGTGPADGYAYNQFELAEIWELPSPSATEIALARTPVWEFHRHFSTDEDKRAVHLLTQDTVAQLFDKEPPGLLKYDAPFLADIEDRHQIDAPQREGE